MTQANFKFISDATGGDRFTVVSFSGNEAISTLYQYLIELKAPLSASISLDDVLDSPARFITDLDGKEYPVYGILSNFQELQTVQGYVHYRAELVPRLWGLSIYKTNEIYTLEKTVDQIIETVLENAGLTSGTDYDMAGLIKDHLLSRDYICQFGESDFDFISRLMENEGIFYYFDQSNGDVEKIIFVNDMNYEPIPRPGLIFDVSTQTQRLYDCIDAWSCRKQRLAGGVTVRDFNPDHPSLDISDTSPIDQMSRGTDYLYGGNIQDEDEAGYLSEIRAEESLCKKTRYYGEGSVTRLQAGFLFEMEMHPNDNYNGVEYLALEVNHEGQLLDTSISSGKAESRPQYRNSFVAIEASEQYRPARTTPKPRFYGTMTAFVYAETGNNLAEIDEFGRYRVHLPFDRADGSKESTDPDRKASTWIRKAQDYVGEGKGSYFPLTGGTEVLLSFINGDPDQPIIVGAVPNASEPSLLNTDNEFESTVQTGSGNKIRMGDVEGEDRIVLESPMANSWIRIGTMNDPITLQGESPQFVTIGSGGYVDPMAISTDYSGSSTASAAGGTAPVVSDPFLATETKDYAGEVLTSPIDTSIAGEYTLKYVDTNNNINDTAFRKVIVCENGSFNDLSGSTTDGIRIRSAGKLSLEAKSRYGEYYTGKPNTPASGATPPELGDLLANYGSGYNPTNLYKRETFDSSTKKYDSYCTTPADAGTANDDSFDKAILNGHVKVSSLDTFNTQEGNVYDFGGYWVYNLGNGYVENHIDQSAELNIKAGDRQNLGAGGGLSGFESDASKVVSYVFVTVGTGASFLYTVAMPACFAALAASATSKGGAIAAVVSGSVMLLANIVTTSVGLSLKYALPGGSSKDVVSGPDSGEISTWANKVGSSFNDQDIQTTESLKSKHDAHYGVDFMPFAPSFSYYKNPMHTDTTWVEKKFGDSYNFTQGNSIDITHGNSEEHIKGDIYTYKYGGLREDTSFSKGALSSWVKSGHGQKTEVYWDKASGQMSNFKYSYKGFFSFTFAMPTNPKMNFKVAMAPLVCNGTISIGTEMNIKLASSLSINIEHVTGFAVNFKTKSGGELNYNEVTQELDFKAFGLKAAKEAALKTEVQKLALERVINNMSDAKFEAKQLEIAIKMSKLSMNSGQSFFT